MHLSYIEATKGIAAGPFVAYYGDFQRVWQATLIIFKHNSLYIWLKPAFRLARYSMPETAKEFFWNMAIMEDDILELLLAYTLQNYPTPLTSGCPPI